MPFTPVELGVIRRQFDRAFIPPHHTQQGRSIEFGETDAVMQCIGMIVDDYFYKRENNEADYHWLIERLSLTQPHVVVMDMITIHKYVLDVLDQLMRT